MEQHTVEVTFEGELLATYTDKGTTYHLFRFRNEEGEQGLFVHWQGEHGTWLETGGLADGVDPGTVASFWPELDAAAFANSEA